ncbi:hypothetical protein JXA56_05515, partial [Candidatus Micrarchaeota archaeon]|nr:hypothetical protein [Candidatus Micrarchaeota archaeon]
MARLRASFEMQARESAHERRMINHRPAFEQLMGKAGKRGFLSCIDTSGSSQKIVDAMRPLLRTAKAKGVENETVDLLKFYANNIKANKIVLLFIRRTENLIATSDPKDIPKLFDQARHIMKEHQDIADTAPQMLLNLRATFGSSYNKLTKGDLSRMLGKAKRKSQCPENMTTELKASIRMGEFNDVFAVALYRQRTANTFELPKNPGHGAEIKPYVIADVNSQDSKIVNRFTLERYLFKPLARFSEIKIPDVGTIGQELGAQVTLLAEAIKKFDQESYADPKPQDPKPEIQQVQKILQPAQLPAENPRKEHPMPKPSTGIFIPPHLRGLAAHNPLYQIPGEQPKKPAQKVQPFYGLQAEQPAKEHPEEQPKAEPRKPIPAVQPAGRPVQVPIIPSRMQPKKEPLKEQFSEDQKKEQPKKEPPKEHPKKEPQKKEQFPEQTRKKQAEKKLQTVNAVPGKQPKKAEKKKPGKKKPAKKKGEKKNPGKAEKK